MIPDIIKISDDMGETFEKCWLAATSPRFFREIDNRRAIESILILKACSEMEQTLSKTQINFKWDIPFRTIANLVLGMVRIFQQQVNNLYENTKYLEIRYRMDSTLFAFKTSQSQKRKSGKTAGEKKEKSDPVKKRKIEPTLSANTLTQMYSILELNEEEERLLNSSDCLVQPAENISLREPAVRTDMSSCRFIDEESIDFGEMRLEDIDYLLGTIQYEKRNHREERDDHADSDATEIFEIPPKRACYRDVDNGAGPHAIKSSLDSNGNNLTNEVICEQDFQCNIIATSTPKSSKSRTNSSRVNKASTPVSSKPSLACSSSNIAENCPSNPNLSSVELDFDYDDLDSTEEFEIPPIENDRSTNTTKEHVLQLLEKKKIQNESKLKIDLINEISNQRFVKQFNFSKTLRTKTPREDCVPLFELKKVNSNKLITTPCHSTLSKSLSSMFDERLKKRKEPRNKNILNYILDVPCEEVIINNLNDNPRTRRKKVKFHENNGETQNENLLICVYDHQVEFNSRASAKNVQNHHPNKPPMPEQTREERLREACRILEKCWSQRQCSINITAICGKVPNRKEAAMAFMSILELDAKGYIDIIKDPRTQEIIHIKKREKA